MADDGVPLPPELEERLYEIHFDAPSAERDARFESLCREHPEHERRLRHHRQTLQRSDQLLGAVPEQLHEALTGETIGPFTLERVLGEGGFGTVYLARQTEPVARLVALKVLQVGRGDTRARQRFEDERQLLARLQHACIAQIFDAGVTEDRRPYFAMEYVDGAPVTAWCREHSVPIEARLRLFLRICAAIQHAHQREIVHRDLKPSNVMVCEQDGEPLPKIIDFGIAKLIATDGGTAAEQTIAGAMIGTPGYMSPEQAVGESVDARTDVYSLGVLLCELLIERPPLAAELLQERNLHAFAKALAESSPRRPSSLSSDAEPELLRRLREDLDWIVVKAVATDREHRYASVAALAEDVERHLSGEPVRARQWASAYLLRKFVRRNRVSVTVGLLVLASLLVAIAALAWGLDMAQQAQTQAERDRDVAHSRERAARMAVAQLAIDSGDRLTALHNLRNIEAPQRGWAWNYLTARLDDSTMQMPISPDTIEIVWLDAHTIATFPRATPPEIWDLQTRTLLRTLPLEHTFRHVVLDRGTGRAVIATDHGWAMWDMADGEILRSFDKENGNPIAQAWSVDHARLAMSDQRRRLTFVDTNTGERIRTHTLGQTATALAFRDDLLLVGCADGTIEARSFPEAEVLWRLEGHTDHVDHLVVDRARDTLYSASIDGTVRAWRLDDQTPIVTLPNRMRIFRLALSTDGETLYAAGGWGPCTLAAWETRTWQLLGRYNGHEFGIRTIAMSPDGSQLASASRDATLRLWSSDPPTASKRLDAGIDARVLSRSADGNRFAAASYDGRITVWNADTLAEELALATEGIWLGSALGRELIYVAGSDGQERTVCSYRLADGALQGRGSVHRLRIEQMQLDAHERWLAGGFRNRLLIWKLPELELRLDLKLPTHRRILWDDARSCFLIGYHNGTLAWIDPELGTIVAEHQVEDTDRAISGVARYDNLLAAAYQRTILVQRDRETQLRLTGGSTSLQFFADGTRLVTCGDDQKVRVWDLATGDQLLVLGGATYGLNYVHVVNNGKRLVALSQRWEAPSYIYTWTAPAVAELPK